MDIAWYFKAMTCQICFCQARARQKSRRCWRENTLLSALSFKIGQERTSERLAALGVGHPNLFKTRWKIRMFKNSRPTPSCDQLHRWGHLGENHDRMRWDWLQPERLGKGVLSEEDQHFKFSLLMPHSASELNEKSEEVSSLWQPFPWIGGCGLSENLSV